MKLNLTLLIIGLFSTIVSSTSLEELDTESIDATTITAIDEIPTPLPPVVGVEVDVPTAEEIPSPPRIKSTNLQCTTARGKPGNCTTVSDCFTLLLPDNGTAPVRNRPLAEMLVEASGFCDGNLQARSDISPFVMDQVLRSQVLLCCPETPSIDPDSFNVDEVDNTSSVYDEMFKGRSCGYINKEIKENRSVSDIELEHADKIVKGRKTKPGEYPWVVAMMNRNRQFCGGSLINQNTILTAAHCVQHMTSTDVKNLRIQIGDWDIYNTNDVKHEVRSAKAVKYHKGFSMKHLQHDIALLILDRPVTFTNNIQAACLHSGNPNVAEGKTKADVAGWGTLSEGGTQPSDLRAVTVRVVTPEACRQRYAGTANKIGDGMICAGSDKGEDSCQGDSGGPLTVDNKSQAKQIGIVSWGIGCGRYPGVYTRVDKYLNWINTNMVKDMGYE